MIAAQMYLVVGMPVFAIIMAIIGSTFQFAALDLRITRLEMNMNARFTSLENTMNAAFTRIENLFTSLEVHPKL